MALKPDLIALCLKTKTKQNKTKEIKSKPTSLADNKNLTREVTLSNDTARDGYLLGLLQDFQYDFTLNVYFLN